MNALITSKRTALVVALCATAAYFVLDYFKGTGTYAFIDFFRGFFTGIAISTFALFVIFVISGWIKRNNSVQNENQ